MDKSGKKNIKKFKMKDISKVSSRDITHGKKASLSAADFENFRVDAVSRVQYSQVDESVFTVPSVLKDVNNLFLLRAKGKAVQTSEDLEKDKEDSIKHVLELIGQLCGFIRRKLLLIKEKYQEDSDDDDVTIPEGDSAVEYIKTVYTEVAMGLGKEFNKLLVGSQTRDLTTLQQEFINEVYVNGDKRNTLLAYPIDDTLHMKNSSKDNIVFIMDHFTKIK